MGEDIRIDPVRMQAEFSLKVPMNLQTAAFPAVVVVSAGALLIRQSGIYQDFVLPGIDEMTSDRLPFSFPWGLSGKFRSRAPVKPAGVDWMGNYNLESQSTVASASRGGCVLAVSFALRTRCRLNGRMNVSRNSSSVMQGMSNSSSISALFGW